MISKVIRFIKSTMLLQMIFGYIFIVSGIIVCSIQVLTLPLWKINQQLYRKINVCLAYCHWCNFTFMAQWWSGTEVLLYMDEKDRPKVGQEHVLVMMNHKYDIDWLMAWILAERFSMLGGTKIFGKAELRRVPFIGWIWYFTESIFLKRNWTADEQIITEGVSRIVNYPENYWITLLLFPEGTRFTPEKLVASHEVCRAKGYPLPKHTLLPRTKGFVATVRAMKGKVPALLNATVGFPSTGPKPTLMTIIKGQPLLAHFHCVRVPLDNVPMETEKACEAWVRDVFRQKDELYDGFLKNGKFKGEGYIVPRRYNDLLMWLFWAVTTCVPLFYYVGRILLSGSWVVIAVVLGVVILGMLFVSAMIQVTESQHGSTYGLQAQPKEQASNSKHSPKKTYDTQQPTLTSHQTEEATKL